MTITYVAAGAASTASNASVTPALPAGVAAGDLLLVVASIRNSGTGTVSTPTGWTQVAASGNVAVLGRFYATGVTAPTVTFAGGVANADTIARCVALRGVSPDALSQSVSAALLNTSGQNVSFPTLLTVAPSSAAVLATWKQDDATAYSTPAGWTSIGLTSTTTGDDASQALFYLILDPLGSGTAAGSTTVTGGAAAISRGLVLALKPAAAIVTHEQDVWPPRVQIVLTGLTIGDSVTVYRVAAGQRTAIRGAVDAVTDTALVMVDAEQPFGVPVNYVAVVAGAAEYESDTVTYALTGGKVAVTDAITGASAEVLIGSAGDMTNGRDSFRARVAGKNIVVTGAAGQDQGSYELAVETTTAYQNLIGVLETSTEGVVQVRQPGGYDGIDGYLAVDAWTTRRISQDGTDPKRLVTIEFAQVDAWPSALTARSFTYGDVEAAYTAPTNAYQDVMGDYATYLDAAQGDFS